MIDWRELTAVVWPAGCPGCGDRRGPVCPQCSRRLLAAPLRRRSLADGTPCVAATGYAGAVRTLVLAAKEGGRRDVRDVLAHALSRALVEAAWGQARQTDGLWVVTPPSGTWARWRRRGDPVADLAVRAAALVRRSGAAADARELLTRRRHVADQAGLGARRRWANVDGAFEVRGPPPAALRGLRRPVAADVVVVDDVITTGATASEAVGALRQAGLRVIGVAAVASTDR